MNEILYRSNQVEVRRVKGDDPKRQVVTFDSYHDEPGFERPGFGEGYFAHYRIGAIHVLTHGNDWFQYAEMDDVCAVIRRALGEAERIISYGSSMGGYAAIRFADAVGAHAVLSISPQYSVDQRKSRFERRWMQDQRRIHFLPEIDGPIRCSADIIVAYDSELPNDRYHVELIGADVEIEELALPSAGHPAGAFLSDIDLLKPMVERALDGTLDLNEIGRLADERREQSASWLSEKSGKLPPGPEAIGLAERSVAIAPDSPPAHDHLGRRLAEAGLFDRAIAEHRVAIALDVGNVVYGYRWNLSKTLHAAGDIEGALEVVSELQRIAPEVAGHHRWASMLKFELGDRAAALVDLEAAIRNAPLNQGYRRTARLLRWRLWFDRLSRLLLGGR